MFIKIGNENIEVKTTLGVSLKIEKLTKKKLLDVFSTINEADILELIDMLALGAEKEKEEFKNLILDNMDYMDLLLKVQEFISRLMFSGTEEQIEEKLEKFGLDEQAKNAIRGLLGLKKVPLTLSESSE